MVFLFVFFLDPAVIVVVVVAVSIHYTAGRAGVAAESSSRVTMLHIILWVESPSAKSAHIPAVV